MGGGCLLEVACLVRLTVLAIFTAVPEFTLLVFVCLFVPVLDIVCFGELEFASINGFVVLGLMSSVVLGVI